MKCERSAFPRKSSSAGGGAAKAHDEAKAHRLVVAALAELGVPDQAAELAGRGRRKAEKELVAAMVRSRRGVTNRWVAARLSMGHEVSVMRAARRSNHGHTRNPSLLILRHTRPQRIDESTGTPREIATTIRQEL